ncbi:tRNA-specific 2-thiouridylase MnmA-like, partial [Trifolium medium]|nr:tRNA-specific 2-thiouridylase MnmA-like [Trifolium medium]
ETETRKMLKGAVRWNWRQLYPLPLTCITRQKPCSRNPYLRIPNSKLFCSAALQTSPSLNAELEPYLRCSMPQKPLRVAVLISGGVDSSVALRLLHAAGHSCTAFYLKIWFQVCSPIFASTKR